MSYSFTDEHDAESDDSEVYSELLQRTMMVPVIDLLNHHYDHHAELSFHNDYLRLVAVRRIKKVGTVFT